MMRDHELIEELIVARALDGLDPDDERTLEREQAAHGADCVECRRLERDYAEVAGRLAFAVAPEPVRPELEDEIVGLATGSIARLERAGVRAPADGVRRRARGVVLRPLIAIAAAFVLFIGGWAIGSLTSGGDANVPAGARVVAFEGADGKLAVAYRPGEAGVYLLGSGLEAPPTGKVYEVWMIQDGTPVPGACVRPSPDGSLFAFADADVGSTQAMAVTIESSSCPSAPTSEPVFTAAITA
jgi:anti-sigma-K factor RskA